MANVFGIGDIAFISILWVKNIAYIIQPLSILQSVPSRIRKGLADNQKVN